MFSFFELVLLLLLVPDFILFVKWYVRVNEIRMWTFEGNCGNRGFVVHVMAAFYGIFPFFELALMLFLVLYYLMFGESILVNVFRLWGVKGEGCYENLRIFIPDVMVVF